MKKVLIFSLIMVILIMLTPSCQKSKTGFNEIYLYTYITEENVFTKGGTTTLRIPARLNLVTGAVTPLCADPLCDHTFESDCAFGSLADTTYDKGFTVNKGYVYFLRRTDATKPDDLVAYNIADARLLMVLSEVDTNGDYGFTGDSFFFIPYEDSLHAVNLSDGSETIIDDIKLLPQAYSGERYYFFDYINRTIFSTDNEFSDRQYISSLIIPKDTTPDFSMIDNKYIFWLTSERNGTDKSRALWRYDMTGSVTEKIAENISVCYFINSMVYYLSPVDNPVFVGTSTFMGTQNIYDNYGGYVWVMELDGSNKKVIARTEGYVLSRSMARYAGDFIAFYYGKFVDYDSDAKYGGGVNWESENGGTIIINIKTGEWQEIPELTFN